MASLLSPVRVILLFAALSVAAIFILPALKVELMPGERTTSISIYFSFPGANPDVVEQEITSVLENACSQLNQLKNINSVSNYNGGVIQLDFDKSVNVPYKKLEIAGIIRRLYPQLPQRVSYPLISEGSNAPNSSPLLVYSINAPLQNFKIKAQMEDIFNKAFAGVSGIREVTVSGAEEVQLTIRFNKDKCAAWHISPSEILHTLHTYFDVSYPGYILNENNERLFLQVPAATATIQVIENILIPTHQRNYIALKDIAAVYLQEREEQSFFRVNGRNAVRLSIYCQKNENKVLLAEKVRAIIATCDKHLPPDYELHEEYDDTLFFRAEMKKNYERIGLSMLVLIVFVLLVYRSWRYLIILLAGLMCTLALSLPMVWLLDIPIHLYTVAGLAIALGIAIDNSIVMLDHYHYIHNRKIFLSMLGASLTTIASLCLVFLLPEEEQRIFRDLAFIVIVILLASLLTALWLTPALYTLLRIKKKQKQQPDFMQSDTPVFPAQAGRSVYEDVLKLLARYRKTCIAGLVLLFGLPVFMLPATWENPGWFQQAYNLTLGNTYYLKNIRPKIDKCLGGTLRLFMEDVYENGGHQDFGKTTLYVQAQLPNGNTPQQMNTILSSFERHLSTIKDVDKFITTIPSGQSGNIEINFRDDVYQSTLPQELKSQLINRSLNWGGVDWDIYGIGQGFSNVGSDDVPVFQVQMKGYNYDGLEKQGHILARKLGESNRVRKVNANAKLYQREKESKEYILSLDARLLALNNVSKYKVLNAFATVAGQTAPSGLLFINNQYYPVVVYENGALDYSSYDLLHNNLFIDSNKIVTAGRMGTMLPYPTVSSIYKIGRQYVRLVSFEFLGAPESGKDYLKEKLNEMKMLMPVGYSAEVRGGSKNEGDEVSGRYYLLIFLLLAAVFFVCSIIFESLVKPFYIIVIIPVSFIGLFLTFYIGGFHFDQGGDAAFIFLGGLVANASIFIVNDFNALRKEFPQIDSNVLLLQTVRNRSRTIFLTTISACCSMVPFLISGKEEVFWFSFAVGTIGGLLFSLFTVLVILPVLLWKRISVTSEALTDIPIDNKVR